MKINMQAVLTQQEVETAIRRYVTSEIPLQEGTEISIEFDFESVEFTAVVTVDGGVEKTHVQDTKPATSGVRERGKPSPGRSRRTQAEIAEDEAADKADAEAQAKNVEDVVEEIDAGRTQTVTFPATTQIIQTRTIPDVPNVDPAILAQLGETVEDNEPPFNIDSKTEQDNAQVNAVKMTKPIVMTNTVGIFPNAGNSAPSIVNDETTAPPPPAVTNGKSLFANLGKPA